MISLKWTHGAGSNSLRSLLPLGTPVDARDRHFHLGSVLCVMIGGRVEPTLIAGPSVHVLVRKALMIAAVWCFIALLLEPLGRLESESGLDRFWDRKNWRKNWRPILLGACFFLSVCADSQIWAAPGACFSCFGLVWLRSTPAQRRWPIAPAGCGAAFTL